MNAEFVIPKRQRCPRSQQLAGPQPGCRCGRRRRRQEPRPRSQAFARDMKRAPRAPAMIEEDAFEVGKNLAITPGSVVQRTEMFELIQYQPTTKTVYRRPLLVISSHDPTSSTPSIWHPGAAWWSSCSRSSSLCGLWRGSPPPNTETGDSTPTAQQSSMRWQPPARSPRAKAQPRPPALAGLSRPWRLPTSRRRANSSRSPRSDSAVAVLDQDHAGLASAPLTRTPPGSDRGVGKPWLPRRPPPR